MILQNFLEKYFFWFCKDYYYICKKSKLMEKEKLSIPEQVSIALDGRTQRWLSFEIRMPEQELSKKMNGVLEFSDDELKKIEERLKFSFEK